MNIEQAKREKAAMEDGISTLLNDFYMQTGLSVSSIQIDTFKTNTISGEKIVNFSHVETVVEL